MIIIIIKNNGHSTVMIVDGIQGGDSVRNGRYSIPECGRWRAVVDAGVKRRA